MTLNKYLIGQQSEAVHTALYGTDWYRLKSSYKSLVPMMLMRTSKPIKLRNGVFNYLCFETFSAVCFNVLSY